jgi:hypothetical protein
MLRVPRSPLPQALGVAPCDPQVSVRPVQEQHVVPLQTVAADPALWFGREWPSHSYALCVSLKPPALMVAASEGGHSPIQSTVRPQDIPDRHVSNV